MDKREILRYAGVRGELPSVEPLLEDCLEELLGQLRYELCFGSFPLRMTEETMDLGFARIASRSLRRHLLGCEETVLFAATLGVAPDRLVAKYSRVTPLRALMIQAIATERIEALCDCFCQSLAQKEKERGREITGRFSPGYGDLSTELQRQIFQVLDCPRRIGVSLSESLFMTPSKSVTALVGVRKTTDGHPR